MPILKVARLGHPVLRAQARPLSDEEIVSDDVQRLIDAMWETLHEYDGVGLAAPQVHESVQLLWVDVPPGRGETFAGALINPTIVAASESIEEDWEGCLSIPDLRGRVPRHVWVRVRAKDRTAKERLIEMSGFAARALQHEIDHLRGVVYLDRMKDFSSLTFLREHSRYWAQPESQ